MVPNCFRRTVKRTSPQAKKMNSLGLEAQKLQFHSSQYASHVVMRIIKKPIIQPKDPEPLEPTEKASQPLGNPAIRSNPNFQPPVNTASSSVDDARWNAARQQRRKDPPPERANKRRKLSSGEGYNSDDERGQTQSTVGLHDGQTYLVRWSASVLLFFPHQTA